MTLTHDTVTENALVDRYAAGALKGEDAFAFETHMVDCSHCQDELELCLSLKQGMRQHVAEATPPRTLPILALVAVLVLAVGIGWMTRPASPPAEPAQPSVATPSWNVSPMRGSVDAVMLIFPAGAMQGLIQMGAEGQVYRLSLWDMEHRAARYVREGRIEADVVNHMLPREAVPVGQWLLDLETAPEAGGAFELYSRCLVEIQHAD